ncbi:hypothetical protein Bpfe_002694 [Biomphalaria pfeifferi]|uniref:Uncharacterized protein n=1 Tax=Biomphalaria pfeifferi TaxID=112525 RepID=A0AAD8C8V0_BIOPF|nr:hypothetical protein Bpfe_002694 [Biomphalaria pfeifferi]
MSRLHDIPSFIFKYQSAGLKGTKESLLSTASLYLQHSLSGHRNVEDKALPETGDTPQNVDLNEFYLRYTEHCRELEKYGAYY